MANDKHLREIVERLLDTDTRCRNDTKFLTYRVFQEIAIRNGEKIYIPFTLFDKFPSFESVARCKRDILNKEGKYKADFEPEPGVTIEPPKFSDEEVIINDNGKERVGMSSFGARVANLIQDKNVKREII